MKTASATKIAAQFNDYLEASREQPVLITRAGKPVAVLVAIQDKAEAERLATGPSLTLCDPFLSGPTSKIKKGGWNPP